MWGMMVLVLLLGVLSRMRSVPPSKRPAVVVVPEPVPAKPVLVSIPREEPVSPPKETIPVVMEPVPPREEIKAVVVAPNPVPSLDDLGERLLWELKMIPYRVKRLGQSTVRFVDRMNQPMRVHPSGKSVAKLASEAMISALQDAAPHIHDVTIAGLYNVQRRGTKAEL